MPISVSDLPDDHWERLLVLRDVVIDTIRLPNEPVDEVYGVLRREFTRDTGMMDIVPDFVTDCADAVALVRYLNRMGVSIDDQVDHIHAAFDPLVEYMELVFRPGGPQKYQPRHWPSKPKTTPFAELPPLSDLPDDGTLTASAWTGRPSIEERARRILYLAPLALGGLEQLIREMDQKRRDNQPPELLSQEDVSVLARLHRELGDLLRMARESKPLDEQFAVVSKLVASSFKLADKSGKLLVSGLPPLAASILPAWGTLKVCEMLLGLDQQSSATVAAGVVAGTYALRPYQPKTGA